MAGAERAAAGEMAVAVEAAISVRDLAYTYPRGRRAAVDGISFDVRRGEILGFLGPSGAGKSTTQKVLTGLLQGWSGQAEVLGRDLRHWEAAGYEHIGVSFELPAHFQKLTALENLRFFASLYERPTADPTALLSAVGLADDAHTRVSAFSKGMQMRLNLVRALLHQPDLLFLDEPTSGLDPVNARAVKDLVDEQRSRGRTVFLTTHDMAAAEELCDRVAFIVDGRLARLDTPRDLKLEHGQRRVRVEYRVDNHLEREEFALAGLADDAAFHRLLREADIQTMHTTEASLDDVFIAVTGRSL